MIYGEVKEYSFCNLIYYSYICSFETDHYTARVATPQAYSLMSYINKTHNKTMKTTVGSDTESPVV